MVPLTPTLSPEGERGKDNSHMADRFYIEHDLDLGDVVIDGAEAHHIASVRRFKVGEMIQLFNGDGSEYDAEIVAVDRKRVTVSIRNRRIVNRELGIELVIASAMPKGDRGDFLIEKLTELGVTRFIPLVTQRSIVEVKATKLPKLSRIVIEASKQCGRNQLMMIEESCRFNELLQRESLPERKLLLHTNSMSEPLQGSATSVIVAVGPEGGFADEEVTMACQLGWRMASLGERILRVETAAIAAAAFLSVS